MLLLYVFYNNHCGEVKKWVFRTKPNQISNHGLCKMFLTVAWDLRALNNAIPKRCPSMSLVPEETDKRKLRALEGRNVSALRDLRGSMTKTRLQCRKELKGTIFKQKRIINLPFMQFYDFFYKTPAEKLS